MPSECMLELRALMSVQDSETATETGTMKAVNRLFTEIIDCRKQFVIPVFQRDFRWTQPQFQQLWRDVGRASGEKIDAHFIGSIVYIEAELAGAALARWLLIDGQQRITTLTLLMIALRDHIRDEKWSGDEDSPTIEKIDAYYLKNTQESGRRQYKLMLRRKDNATLQALVDEKYTSELGDERSELLIEAYDFFRSSLKESTYDPDEIYRGIARLGVVDVTLDRNTDDPQLVFESMNSTGIALRESDLVRNYLLMGLDETEQTRLYEDYWKKIESFFRASDSALDWFLRDYMALEHRLAQQIRLDRVYHEFKSFWSRGWQAVGRFARRHGPCRKDLCIIPRTCAHKASEACSRCEPHAVIEHHQRGVGHATTRLLRKGSDI